MQSSAVPKKTKKKDGVRITVLIDCIAAMPLAGAMRSNAAMMKVEKTKNRPAIRPDPSAAAKMIASITNLF